MCPYGVIGEVSITCLPFTHAPVVSSPVAYSTARFTVPLTEKWNRNAWLVLSFAVEPVSAFVIHFAPDSRTARSSASSNPIHFAFQLSCLSNPVSHQLTSLAGYAFPSRSHTITRQKYRLLGCIAGPPYATPIESRDSTFPLSHTSAFPDARFTADDAISTSYAVCFAPSRGSRSCHESVGFSASIPS